MANQPQLDTTNRMTPKSRLALKKRQGRHKFPSRWHFAELQAAMCGTIHLNGVAMAGAIPLYPW